MKTSSPYTWSACLRTMVLCFAVSACSSDSDEPFVLSPQDFETTEFFNSGGLDQINAQFAYAEGATGRGVTVGVVDTGVDPSHPDLAANMHPASINIRTLGVINDFDGHGTAVAGIIGAVKNDSDTHGVAFDSRILGVRADNCDTDPACSPLFNDDDVAAGIDYAVANGARVVNLSLGGGGAITVNFANALENAATQGVAVVASTGNAGAAQPELPAGFATDPRAGGTLLAVGAVDAANQIAGFSNECGAARDFCLVAPGANILTTNTGGGTIFFSGTSASTPHVAGAIAALMSVSPGLSALDVVQILLTTATDLGAPGTDDVYGRGLLNLSAAFQPIGPLSVPLGTTTAATALLDETSLVLGPAFGDAMLRYGAILDWALALDSFRRPYRVGLTPAISTADRGISWDGTVVPDPVRTIDAPGPFGTSFAFKVREAERPAAGLVGSFAESAADAQDDPSLEGMTFSAALDRNTRLVAGFGLAPGQITPSLPGARTTAGLFLHTGESMAPHLGIVGTANGTTLTHRLSAATRLQVGWFDGKAASSANLDGSGGDDAEARLFQARISHRFGAGVVVEAGFASVDEDRSFLTGSTGGAFGEDTGARSNFATLSAVVPVSGKVDIVASYGEAMTDIGTSGASLLSHWTTVRANAFAAGVVSRDALARGDRIGLMASQPLRVYSAEATLTVPETANADGSINFTTQRIDVTPTGREIDLQLAYDRRLLPGVSLQGWILGRLQPGHDRDAEPDYGVGAKLRARF